MREWALIVLIFIALMAGGHRMDEQFSPSLKAVSWSYVKLSKAERAVLFSGTRLSDIVFCALWIFLQRTMRKKRKAGHTGHDAPKDVYDPE